MKYLSILMPLILVSVASFDASANSLPSLGSTGSGSEVTTASGASCRSGTQRTILDFGVTAKSYNNNDNTSVIINDPYANRYSSNIPQDKGMVYARIVVPLGAKSSQINCKRMYNLELSRMKTENELLRRQVEQMRNAAVTVSID
jgi:hypothetical protein